MYGKSNMETYVTIYKIDSQREFAVCLRKLKQGLCINLEGWDGREMGGRFKSEGIYVYLWLILEKVMATHSSTLAWKIPWTEEPGRLQSMGSLRVRHDNWATSLSLFIYMHWRRKQQPTPVFLPGESQGWGSLVGCHLWGCTESDSDSDVAAAAWLIHIKVWQKTTQQSSVKQLSFNKKWIKKKKSQSRL